MRRIRKKRKESKMTELCPDVKEEGGELHLVKDGLSFDEYVRIALELTLQYGKTVFWSYKGCKLNTGMGKRLEDFVAIHFVRSAHC